jgi:hypothetical protein
MIYIYSELAKKYQCGYLNAAEIVEVGTDGVHIDEKSHTILANAIYNVILSIK